MGDSLRRCVFASLCIAMRRSCHQCVAASLRRCCVVASSRRRVAWSPPLPWRFRVSRSALDGTRRSGRHTTSLHGFLHGFVYTGPWQDWRGQTSTSGTSLAPFPYSPPSTVTNLENTLATNAHKENWAAQPAGLAQIDKRQNKTGQTHVKNWGPAQSRKWYISLNSFRKSLEIY